MIYILLQIIGCLGVGAIFFIVFLVGSEIMDELDDVMADLRDYWGRKQ